MARRRCAPKYHTGITLSLISIVTVSGCCSLYLPTFQGGDLSQQPGYAASGHESAGGGGVLDAPGLDCLPCEFGK